jgi:hypothetical protein
MLSVLYLLKRGEGLMITLVSTFVIIALLFIFQATMGTFEE